MESEKYVKKGEWNSIHVVEVQEKGAEAVYRLTTTVLIALGVEGEQVGDLNLSGGISRQVRSILHAHAYLSPSPTCFLTFHTVQTGRKDDESCGLLISHR